MVYGAGNQMIKFLVFIANLLIFIFGAMLFGFSLWANLDKNFDVHLREFAQKMQIDEKLVDEMAQYQSSLWILVAIGVVLMVVGFLGCCGAACESLILLTLFAIIMILLVLIELYVLVSIFSNRPQLLDNLQSALAQSAETEEGRRNLKPIENILNCCGATAKTRGIYIDEGHCPGELEFASDCYNVLAAKIDTMGTALLVCGVLLLLVQLFSILFSSVLCRAFRERVPYYQ